jgi:putative transposase
MAQSLVKNYVHIVFSTKHRQPFIQPPFEAALHTYLGGVCNALECQVLTVGGYTDHVHILCLLSRKIALMTLVQKVKSNSSSWMKTQDESLKNFFWQDGYGAFSVNQRGVERVTNYIKNQHAHHSKKDFKTEYRQILKKYQVDYDEAYVWD